MASSDHKRAVAPEGKHNRSVKPERSGGKSEQAAEAFFPNISTVCAVLETAQIGVWCWDVAAGKVTWSSNLEAIHRLPAGSFDGTHAGFEGHVCRDDWPKVEASLQEALRTHSAYRVRYRLSERAGDAGRDEERWLEASGTTAVEDGEPARMLGLCRDITERVKLEAELRSRIKQQEALAQLGERAMAETDLELLLNDAASTVAMTLGVEFVSILELLPGNTDLLLRAGFGWNPDLIGTIVTSTAPGGYARYALDSSTPVVTADSAAETRFRLDPCWREHGGVAGMHAAIAGRDNRSYGILGVCSKAPRQFSAAEIAFVAAAANLLAGAIARRQAEQRHEMMIRDMRHRSGNLFSQLLALFSQTAKNSKSIADLANKYRARVLALANAQRLITESGGKTTPLVDLLNVLLAPYLDRTSYDGPDVELEPEPVFNLSAAVQELVDNAVKHGSLSRAKGRLELSWSVSRTDRGATLLLDWVEKSGPVARKPRRSGFGARLIALAIERQLNGEVTRTYSREGLSVHLVVPLTRQRWPSGAAAPARDGANVTDARPR